MSRISIVIPVYNDNENLRKCLDSLEQSTHTDFQLIVVDDGSDDPVNHETRRRCDQFVRLDENKGQAAARNRGARLADSGLLFFLDADITLEPDTLEHILKEFTSNPDISALFCSYQEDTPPKNFVSQFKNLQHHFTHKIARRQAVTFCGGFGAIRRDVFLEVDGYDEDMRFMEDVQLGYRLSQAGNQILLCPSIQLTHNKVYSLTGLVKSDVFQRAIPWTRLMLEQREYHNDLNTSSNNVASVVVVFLMLLSLFIHPGGWAGMLAVEGGWLLIFILLNARFLKFTMRVRGLWFTLQTIPMLWFQYLYSGVGLSLGVLAYLRNRMRSRT